MLKSWLLALVFMIAAPCFATELDWQTIDSLPEGEKALAQSTLFDLFGDNPEYWPDWIDPRALFVPVRGGHLLIVQRPQHLPCGYYGFAIFGPVTAEGQRDKYGDFCGGKINIIAVPGRDWPDIEVLEGRVPTDDEQWQRLDQRLRYENGQWWRVLQN